MEGPTLGILFPLPPFALPLGFGVRSEHEGDMKLKWLAAAAAVVVSVPAFADDAGVRHQRQRPVTDKELEDTRPGHIPTPPRPRPDRARPAFPQRLAATFLGH